MQQTALSALTPATCKHLELTFQQLPQSYNAPAAPSAVSEDIIRYMSAAEIKSDNGPGSVGSDFHNDSSTSESWASSNQQQYQPGIASTGGGGYSGFSAASANTAAEAPDRKMSNRLTGPRKPKPTVAVSRLLVIIMAVGVLTKPGNSDIGLGLGNMVKDRLVKRVG